MTGSAFGGSVTQGYGPTSDTAEPAFGGYPHFHQGVDYADPAGTPVVAPQGGTVVANTMGEYGYGPNLVLVKMSNGLIELFGHMKDSLVSVGQTVKAGQVVGDVGSLGNSTGPHLHYGVVTAQGAPVDPTPYITALPAGQASGQTPAQGQASGQGQASVPGSNIPVIGGLIGMAALLFGGLFRVILTILGIIAILIGFYLLVKPDDAPGVGDAAKMAGKAMLA